MCGHHANKNVKFLTKKGWEIVEDVRTFKSEDPNSRGDFKERPGQPDVQRTALESGEDVSGWSDEGEAQPVS